MPTWSASNLGQWLDLNNNNDVIIVEESLPGDRSTLTGGLLILGHAHGVRAHATRPRHSMPAPLSPRPIAPTPHTIAWCVPKSIPCSHPIMTPCTTSSPHACYCSHPPLTACPCPSRAQSHLAAGYTRSGTKTAAALVVRPTAVVVTDIGLLAQGRLVIWLQDADEVDEADWTLFEELQAEPGFNAPFKDVLDAKTLKEVMKGVYAVGELAPTYIGNPKGSGGLREAWPPLTDFRDQFHYFVQRTTVINLVQAVKRELEEAEGDAMEISAVAAAEPSPHGSPSHRPAAFVRFCFFFFGCSLSMASSSSWSSS